MHGFFIIYTIIVTYLTEAIDNYQYNRYTYLKNLTTKYPGYGTEFIFFPGENGELRKGYLQTNPQMRILGSIEDIEKEVYFTLYTRSLANGQEMRTRKDLLKSPFNKKKKTKIITHGWMSSGKSDTCMSIKNAYLNMYDVNVFIMDWSSIADNVFYPIPMKATPDVANYYSQFLNYLIDTIGADPKDFHLIGHSLGAHVSGFAARRVKKGKIGRVSGLDPALPGFGILSFLKDGSVNSTDAEFVDIIHTCMGVLGMETAIGHVDFYPNGGIPPQPGCANILEMIEACSHGRSWHYFADSINTTNPFMAYHCPTYDDFVMGRNCFGDSIPMGDPVPLTARGTYYLKTELNY